MIKLDNILDRFTDVARQAAEEQARHHGRELGATVAITPPKAAWPLTARCLDIR